ncbi:MAG: hypothetical protein KAJ19_29890, partial [Gammaproteobacteria bacterium]|nr:hypothetical protein [Gammaproteobacteria bacterium]
MIVFTDKKVYTDHGLHPRSNAADGFRPKPLWVENNDLRSIVYAIVLDDDGNMMTGTDSSISATLNDVKILSHAGASARDLTTHHSTIIDDPNYVYMSVSSFNDDGLNYDSNANDGITSTIFNIPDFAIADPFTWNGSSFAESDAHILLQINVTYSGSPTLTTNVTIMISPQTCHNGDKDEHAGVNAHDDDEGNDMLVCTACHWGYEHLYNGANFPEIPPEFDDVHAGRITLPSFSSIAFQKNGVSFHPNTSYNDPVAWTDWDHYSQFDFGANKYCYSCHYESTGGSLLEYDGESGTARNDVSERPSCSVASKTLTVGTITCHATTDMEGGAIPAWEPAMATSQATDDGLLAVTAAASHNHSTTTPSNVSCALCHGTSHNFKVPNSTATTINEQCWTCHNVSDGYINSRSHDPAKTDCESCHTDGTRLDSHLVPTAGVPNPNCTECHILGGPAALHIDFDVFNNSNNIHNDLNNQSTTGAAVRPTENRICWACHGEDDNSDGQADFSEQPATAHPTNYDRDNAKNCTDCHNNAGADNFGAPQNAAHTWYDAEITTSAVSECGDCHSEPEMYDTSHSDDDGITKASIANHYSTPHSYLPGVRGQDEYCRYCHQNSSTVFSSAFNNS